MSVLNEVSGSSCWVGDGGVSKLRFAVGAVFLGWSLSCPAQIDSPSWRDGDCDSSGLNATLLEIMRFNGTINHPELASVHNSLGFRSCDDRSAGESIDPFCDAVGLILEGDWAAATGVLKKSEHDLDLEGSLLYASLCLEYEGCSAREGAERLSQLASQGSEIAQYAVGYLALECRNLVELEDDQILEFLNESSSAGFAPSQVALALIYFYGLLGQDEDPARSWREIASAVDQDFALGHHVAGQMHFDEGRLEHAIQEFSTSVSLGLEISKFYLALVYWELAEDGKEDFAVRALSLAEEALEYGAREAGVILGLAHAIGLGVPLSRSRARRFFEGAIGTGAGRAEYFLAMMYQTGSGVEKNRELACRLHEQAFAQGNQASAYPLGLCLLLREELERGYGVLMKAAAQGDESSAQFLEEFPPEN